MLANILPLSGSGDFLHGNAETLLRERYVAAGAVCELWTNAEPVLQAARASFFSRLQTGRPSDFCLRVWVGDADAGGPPWPAPYVRGLGHRVFVGFDAQNSFLADLSARRIIGRVSPAMAGDAAYWRNVIFPILMSVVAGSVGLVELHGACLASEGEGLVLIGAGRSGKSTLAMALAEAGFTFVSDDRLFCSVRHDSVVGCGLPRPLKLRQEAASWFPGFREREPAHVQNGERVFLCEPNRIFGRTGTARCAPRMLLFLERQPEPLFQLIPTHATDARERIQEDLLAEDGAGIARQDKVLDALSALPCWRLQYGGRPQDIAERIAELFFENSAVAIESRTARGAL